MGLGEDRNGSGTISGRAALAVPAPDLGSCLCKEHNTIET